MQKDLKDSIKVRLYDFKYTPFLSAYIFSWIYFNSKLILIFTAPKLSVEKKIEMLSWGQIDYWTPVYFALCYVFLFPLATALFYAVTLGYKALMNWIQQKIQDRTPLPLEQANAIREENIKLELEYKKVANELEKIKQDYTLKENSLTEQFSNKVNELVKDKTKQLNIDLRTAYNDITDKNTELTEKNTFINKLENKISELENEISKLKPVTTEPLIIDNAYKKVQKSSDKVINALTLEHIKILATFYETDSKISKNVFKNHINSKYKVSKTLVDSWVNDLKKLGFVSSDTIGNYTVSNEGQKVIEDLFYN